MRRTVQKSQSGFTLIELVVVIVILGILAATALPKFVDMGVDARKAATTGVVGALASSSNINYSAGLAKGLIKGKALSTAATTGLVDTSGGCTTTVATNLLQTGGVKFDNGTTPAAGTYKIEEVAAATLTNNGDTVECKITSNDESTATGNFTLFAVK